MELRHMKYFVAVAEELHFRRAAERLHVAQPAVSEQIRKLEQELGVRLFDRDQRHVELTGAGTALLDEARRLLRQADVARQVARNAHAQGGRRLRVGYVESALPTAVPRALRQLAALRPPVVTSLESGPALGLLEAVRAGRLDAAIACLPAPASGLNVHVIGALEAVIAVPVGDRRAQEAEIDLARLAPERLVLQPRVANPAFYDAVVAACRAAGCAPSLVELDDAHVDHALLAVASGAGMAVLPDVAAQRHHAPGLRLLPLAGRPATCEVAVMTPTGAPQAATAALLDALRRAAWRPQPAVAMIGARRVGPEPLAA
jgi:DNA-binding transcriptional LysR family regulator